ncbi:uracil-DNA glycosylase [Orrella sp. JC864]|uniref:uracil-DNA glycosylase n=1 Tax=Orrella sp. JC864 TaxID=3120298 RepID=UPI00300B78F7
MNLPDADVFPVPAVQPSALQRIWLRELGVEKHWLPPAPARAPAPGADPCAAQPAAQPGKAGPAAAPASAPGPGGPARLAPPVQAPAGIQAGRVPAKPSAPSKPAAEGEAARQTAQLAAQSDFDQLREHVLACTACGLCQGRKQAVYGVGVRQATWMVVGEAPGEQEDRKGEPFVGRSGQLLDAMLASVGKSRASNVFIANVIKCRPPGNRNPRPEEIAACSPYLMRQIELLKPERLLVLGRFAAQTLLRTDAPIGSLRGRVHTLDTPDGRQVPLVVSYHPAYLLRSPLEKAKAWQDLRLAASLM